MHSAFRIFSGKSLPRALLSRQGIDTPLPRHRRELVGNTQYRFRTAQEQHAVIGHQLGNFLQNLALGRLIKINQHVAAEHHIEMAERGQAVQQVVVLVLNHRADFRLDLPLVILLVEILDQQRDRQAALHLELGIEPLFGLLQDLAGNIRADDLDLPTGKLGGFFLEDHRQRIGLLPVRRGGAPDA